MALRAATDDESQAMTFNGAVLKGGSRTLRRKLAEAN
jgi:hypothetical protein